MTDKRPELYVSTDHNPDDVRTFYELPEAILDRLRPGAQSRTVAQALADLIEDEQRYRWALETIVTDGKNAELIDALSEDGIVDYFRGIAVGALRNA